MGQVLQVRVRPFFYSPVSEAIQSQILEVSDQERAHLLAVLATIDPETALLTPVTAATKPLNRYSIMPGKTFAASPKAKEKYKILRLVADDVVFQNSKSLKVQTVPVNRLLQDWSAQGFQEVSLLSDIIETVKNLLGPMLGLFLTTALISWLTEKLGR